MLVPSCSGRSVRAASPASLCAGALARLIYRVLTFWLPLLLTAATYHLVIREAPGRREHPQ